MVSPAGLALGLKALRHKFSINGPGNRQLLIQNTNLVFCHWDARVTPEPRKATVLQERPLKRGIRKEFLLETFNSAESFNNIQFVL